MTADFQDLVLEQPRAIRTDVFDIKEMLGRVELGISEPGQQVGALTTAVYSGRSELDTFMRRLERRLDLSDTSSTTPSANQFGKLSPELSAVTVLSGDLAV